MSENFESQHFVSSDLRPIGGSAVTHGTTIQWANGENRPKPGTAPEGPVGTRVRDLLEICEDRVSFLGATLNDDWNLIGAQIVDLIEQVDAMENGDKF